MNGDYFRIAAIGDIHLTGSDDDAQLMRSVFTAASEKADVLAICGDLTCHGRADELRGLIQASADLDIPAVAVLGNHDHESDREDELIDLLTSVGVDVLEGTALVVEGVGFAGVKGFGGGFGLDMVEAFGERALKDFVEEMELELTRLDDALEALRTETKVVLMHYENAIDKAKARVVFHGHAHLGAPMAATRGGAPVFNVALPVLRRERMNLRTWSTRRAATGCVTEATEPLNRIEQ